MKLVITPHQPLRLAFIAALVNPFNSTIRPSTTFIATQSLTPGPGPLGNNSVICLGLALPLGRASSGGDGPRQPPMR